MELLGGICSYPMIIYYWIKGEKIQTKLAKKIDKAKQKSSQIILNEKNEKRV